MADSIPQEASAIKSASLDEYGVRSSKKLAQRNILNVNKYAAEIAFATIPNSQPREILNVKTKPSPPQRPTAIPPAAYLKNCLNQKTVQINK